MKRPKNVEPGKWGTKIVFWSPVSKTKTDQNGDEHEDQFFVLSCIKGAIGVVGQRGPGWELRKALIQELFYCKKCIKEVAQPKTQFGLRRKSRQRNTVLEIIPLIVKAKQRLHQS